MHNFNFSNDKPEEGVSLFAWEPLTRAAQDVVVASVTYAQRLSSSFITPEHLLLGVLDADDNAARQILSDCSIDVLDVSTYIKDMVLSTDFITATNSPLFSVKSRAIFEIAFEEAQYYRHPSIGTQHLLFALSSQPGIAQESLKRAGVTFEDVANIFTSFKYSDENKEGLSSLS